MEEWLIWRGEESGEAGGFCMRRREIVLLTIAAIIVLSARLGGPSYADIPLACQEEPDSTIGIDPRLPCTIPVDVEVNDRSVVLTWSVAEVESILGDDFGGYKVWRWRVPRGYDVRDPMDPNVLLPDTSSYTLLQVLARRDTSAIGYPVSFDSSKTVWTFNDPDSLFDFDIVGTVRFNAATGDSDSVWVRQYVPRFESGPINGFPYYYAVTYFGNVIDTLFAAPCDTCPEPMITMGLSSKMPDPATNFAFPVFPGGRPAADLGGVVVIPNPYSDYAAWEYFGSRKIQFINLPDRSKIDIYTVGGDFVRALELDAGARGTGDVNTLDWDLRSGAGEEITAGVYIYRVEAPNGRESIGRFVVIR
jgi:hypothetical protein